MVIQSPMTMVGILTALDVCMMLIKKQQFRVREIPIDYIIYHTNYCFKVANRLDASKPHKRHVQGTLRELHHITTTFPENTCPPLNTISLPAGFRNLTVPSKWESIASHELAQTRVPTSYSTLFDVPDTRHHTEWSLIGGKNAISSMHIDSEGFGTAVIVLEGSKYWIIATQIGEDEDLCTVDSLGPDWDPYVINEGSNMSRYRFEAVNLRKGDML